MSAINQQEQAMTKMYSEEQVRSLAVRYNGFMNANRDDDLDGLIVWSRMLQDRQTEMGMELVSNRLLAERRRYALDARIRRERAAALPASGTLDEIAGRPLEFAL